MTAETMRPSDWRDMESAPRDGTDVLLERRNPYRTLPPIVAGWHEIEPGESGWVAYDQPTTMINGVTAWMPLPAPPETRHG